jgi:D-alanyl-D-alanine carboxypeptidase
MSRARRKASRGGSAIAVVLGVLLLWAAPASASDRFLESRLDRLLEVGVPGAKVNVDGRTAARGVADLATRRPMRPGLAFRAGSITKSFVATFVLQLVAERRVRLGDTVEQWLPGLLPYGDAVTVRTLLQHTSGVPDFWEAGPDPLNISFISDPAVRAQTYSPHQLVARVSGEPPDFVAGSRVEYSNTNYVMLGLIVEAATGKSLTREITRRVIRRLHLHDTEVPTRRTSLPRPFTRGYSFFFDADGLPVEGPILDVTEYNPSSLWAVGNVVSTLDDLRTFYRALLGGRLLPPALTALMKETRPNQTAEWPEGVGMGLGIWSWDLPCGRRIYGHEGEAPGSNAWAFSTADGRRTVVMQHNLLYLNWDRWFDTVLPTYFSFWCGPSRPRRLARRGSGPRRPERSGGRLEGVDLALTDEHLACTRVEQHRFVRRR